MNKDEEYLLRTNAGLAGRIGQTNPIAGAWRENQTGNLWLENRNPFTASSVVQGDTSGEVDVMNNPQMHPLQSQSLIWGDFDFDDLLFSNDIHCSLSSLLNCDAQTVNHLYQNGSPASQKPHYDLNSPPRIEADGFTTPITSSPHFVPQTPNRILRTEYSQPLEGQRSSTGDRLVQEKEHAENTVRTAGNNTPQQNIDGVLQNIAESSVVNSTAQKDLKDGSEQNDEGIDLNKTPQVKQTKRKKYMPKVIKESKPKRKTSKSAAPTTAKAKEKTAGKRKHRLSVNQSAVEEPDGIREREDSSYEIPSKSCKRSLDFDLEKDRDGKQVVVEKQQGPHNSTFVSSIRDSDGPNISLKSLVASLGQQNRQHSGSLQQEQQTGHHQNQQPSFLRGIEYCKQTGLHIKNLQSELPAGNRLGLLNSGKKQARKPTVNHQPGLPTVNLQPRPSIGDQKTRSPIRNQRDQQTGLPIGNWQLGGNQPPRLLTENLQIQMGFQIERQQTQAPALLIKSQQSGLPIWNPQSGLSVGKSLAQTVGGCIPKTGQVIPGDTLFPERQIVESSQAPGTNMYAEFQRNLARNMNAMTWLRNSITGCSSLQQNILEGNGYIPILDGSNVEAINITRKLTSPIIPHSALTNFPKPFETEGSLSASYPAVGQTNTSNTVSSSVFPRLSEMQEFERNRQRMIPAFSEAHKRMKVQNGLGTYMHRKHYEVIAIEDNPDVPLLKGSDNDNANGVASRRNTLPIQGSTKNEKCVFVPPTPPRMSTAMKNQLVVYDANATEIGTKKSQSLGEKAKENQNKLLNKSGKARGPLGGLSYTEYVDEITNKLQKLNLGDMTIQTEANAIVLYQDRAVVPYEIKKRKPRPKVDLDEETNRIWNLLLGKGGSENYQEEDAEKEKWWEEERRVFRGRADSFIARMHLVQGDRRFSPWKGSVVDSVVGVFLTQNVSDVLSSSAFMSLAARFPRSSKCNIADDRNTACTFVEEAEPCLFNLNEIPAWQEMITQHPPETQVLGVNIPSKRKIEESSNSRIERISFVDDSTRNLEEEGVSSQDSFDPPGFHSSGEIGFCSGSSSDAEFSTTRREPNTANGSANFPCNGVTTLLHETHNKVCRNPQEQRGPNSGYGEKTTCNAQQELKTEGNSSNGSTSFGRPVNDDYGEMEVPTNQCSITQQQTQPQVLDMDNFGWGNEENFFSWLTVGDGNQATDLHGRATQAQNVAHQPTDQSETKNNEAFSFSGKQQICQENSPIHGSHLQHNKPYSQHDDMKQLSQPQCTFRELLNMSEECFARQSNDSGTIQNILDAPNLKGTFPDVEQRNTMNKNASLGNKLVSSNQSHSLVENEESNSTILQTTKKKPGDEKKTPTDWDNLRKEVMSNRTLIERSKDREDSIDYEALRNAKVSEISDAIKERGMNNMLAERIKEFLDRLVKDHGSIDLEWLRDVNPDQVKEYLLSIRGLGLKSVECVRLLSLQNLAFPVDTNVGRIAVRLGWVPLQPLPESLQLHLLEMYPVLESIQKYLWPRLCKLDQRTLYELHYQLITFGKVFCTKSKPNCNACPMRAECRHFASAFASARLALPGPEEKVLTSASVSIKPEINSAAVIPPMQLPPPEKNLLMEGSNAVNCEPIIEEPATPEQECTQVTESDIEDAYYEDPDEIPTIKLNLEEFSANLQQYMEKNMELQEVDMSKALVALDPTAASLPTPKLKNVSRLRTEHQVYELPDSHPLLEGMDKREPDDPTHYLLAIWTPGETASSTQIPHRNCESQDSGQLCNEETCYSCNSVRETNSQTVRGTLLIPCRTAMRGSFPLNGTYFQVNEVFADNESSINPIDVPRNWIWNLPRRTVYFGTSVTSIFKGLTTEQIQYCFWRGYVCVRGFEQKTRAPRPLMARLHFPASKLKARNDNPKRESKRKHDAEEI